MTIVMACLSGLVFTFNTITIQQCIRCGLDVQQANFDGNYLLVIFMLPGYIVNYKLYTGLQLMYGTLALVFIMLAVVSISYGLKNGTVASVQALENQKAVVLTVIIAIVKKKVPNGLQIGGLVAGLVGVLILVCQNKD